MPSAENDLDPESAGYARLVGERLRAIRRQKRLSLQEAEELSEQEFKASVLGAYERGERAISVPRLHRLARVYQVPVDQLLPRDAADGRADGTYLDLTQPASPAPRKIVIDLARVEDISGPTGEMLRRYLAMIQVQRQDFNGRVLTIRRDDLRAIACVLDTPSELTTERLDELGILFRGTPVLDASR
ncbi:transcriptional regulator [Aquihabitans sp. G128]|uniref:transcriptional regulator n=1 Tax=Aquihabitans sp. G128 TaxID=2849779 RepID=UPI001C21276B|nr:transcriptional regulator [Aquihabitans sp. G128]QXC61554.1 transcriptional regulator [Aquihabitans sp. G128]